VRSCCLSFPVGTPSDREPLPPLIRFLRSGAPSRRTRTHMLHKKGVVVAVPFSNLTRPPPKPSRPPAPLSLSLYHGRSIDRPFVSCLNRCCIPGLASVVSMVRREAGWSIDTYNTFLHRCLLTVSHGHITPRIYHLPLCHLYLCNAVYFIAAEQAHI
jgi:hypothetical protein